MLKIASFFDTFRTIFLLWRLNHIWGWTIGWTIGGFSRFLYHYRAKNGGKILITRCNCVFRGKHKAGFLKVFQGFFRDFQGFFKVLSGIETQRFGGWERVAKWEKDEINCRELMNESQQSNVDDIGVYFLEAVGGWSFGLENWVF